MVRMTTPVELHECTLPTSGLRLTRLHDVVTDSIELFGTSSPTDEEVDLLVEIHDARLAVARMDSPERCRIEELLEQWGVQPESEAELTGIAIAQVKSEPPRLILEGEEVFASYTRGTDDLDGHKDAFKKAVEHFQRVVRPEDSERVKELGEEILRIVWRSLCG